jgi:hypothetical protein
MKTILALDLGKFKTVSCLLTEDHSSIPVFKTIMTNPKTFEQFLIDVKPSLLVLEACGVSGWVVDLARKLGVETNCHSLKSHQQRPRGNRRLRSIVGRHSLRSKTHFAGVSDRQSAPTKAPTREIISQSGTGNLCA